MKLPITWVSLWVCLCVSGCARAPDRTHCDMFGRIAIIDMTLPDDDNPAVLGLHVTADDIALALHHVRAERPDVIVLRLPEDSIGLPIDTVNQVFDTVYSERFDGVRIVGWVRSARGGVAVLAWGLPELIVSPGCTFGPATLGARGSIARRSFDRWKAAAERASEISGRPDPPIKTQQTGDPLFRSPRSSGERLWSNADSDGWTMVRSDRDWTPFATTEMLEYGFAKAVADSTPELVRALGFQEVTRVGDQPVAALQRRVIAAKHAEELFQVLYRQYVAQMDELRSMTMPIPPTDKLTITLVLSEIAELTKEYPSVAASFDFQADRIAQARKEIDRLSKPRIFSR